MLGSRLPRWPERSLRADDGAHVERILRGGSGPEWVGTDDFAAASRRYRRAIQVAGVAHCALEYYRWAVRSQLRAEGRRFAAAVARRPTVPVLQVHGAHDPCLLAPHRGGVAALGRPAPAAHVLPGTGHFPHEERPDATTSLLLEFLWR